MAARASSSLTISTKPNPRLRPVSRSLRTWALLTVPYCSNSSCSSAEPTVYLRLPTYSRFAISIARNRLSTDLEGTYYPVRAGEAPHSRRSFAHPTTDPRRGGRRVYPDRPPSARIDVAIKFKHLAGSYQRQKPRSTGNRRSPSWSVGEKRRGGVFLDSRVHRNLARLKTG